MAQLIDLQVPPLRHGCDTNNVLIDLHAHTAPRSNCSTTTLGELVAAARARGLDALCVTEHDVRWPDDELADASRLLDFPLIPGVELTTDVGHVLAFGPLEKPLWMGYKLEELVAETERTGTALVLPHPVRRTAGERAVLGGRTPPTPEFVAAMPQWSAVHAIEVASTQTTPLEHTLTAAALSVVPRPAIGASDAHGPGLAGTYATRLDRRVDTAVELAAEIRAGHVAPVHVT
jgi:predicted metal-dependent phosphoesterase TrpH